MMGFDVILIRIEKTKNMTCAAPHRGIEGF
jgi:hypothetical protein